MALEEGLAEGRQEVDIVPYVSQGIILLYQGCIACVEEAVD